MFSLSSKKGGSPSSSPAQVSPPVLLNGHEHKALSSLRHLHDVGEGHDSRRDSKYLSHAVARTVPGQEDLVEPSGVPKSLGDILKSQVLRNKFRQFLKERHANESLLFYESVELYEAIPAGPGGDKWRARAAEGIISKFVDSSAVYEINLSAPVRMRLMATTRWTPEAFRDARAEIYELLRANFLHTFLAKEFLRGTDE